MVGSHTILRSYHFYDPSAILNVLVRWDRKIMRVYDPDRDFNNHICKLDIEKAYDHVNCEVLFIFVEENGFWGEMV